jgi:hypothetical protein
VSKPLIVFKPISTVNRLLSISKEMERIRILRHRRQHRKHHSQLVQKNLRLSGWHMEPSHTRRREGDAGRASEELTAQRLAHGAVEDDAAPVREHLE